jgi:hypothetical protein
MQKCKRFFAKKKDWKIRGGGGCRRAAMKWTPDTNVLIGLLYTIYSLVHVPLCLYKQTQSHEGLVTIAACRAARLDHDSDIKAPVKDYVRSGTASKGCFNNVYSLRPKRIED